MISTADPETMTAEERHLEIANILARGLLRRVRMATTAMLPAQKIVSEGPETDLDVPTETRLSVAQRPAG